jgi:predicted metallo-beta-lactamase superfamily hydrolase
MGKCQRKFVKNKLLTSQRNHRNADEKKKQRAQEEQEDLKEKSARIHVASGRKFSQGLWPLYIGDACAAPAVRFRSRPSHH